MYGAFIARAPNAAQSKPANQAWRLMSSAPPACAPRRSAGRRTSRRRTRSDSSCGFHAAAGGVRSGEVACALQALAKRAAPTLQGPRERRASSESNLPPPPPAPAAPGPPHKHPPARSAPGTARLRPRSGGTYPCGPRCKRGTRPPPAQRSARPLTTSRLPGGSGVWEGGVRGHVRVGRDQAEWMWRRRAKHWRCGASRARGSFGRCWPSRAAPPARLPVALLGDDLGGQVLWRAAQRVGARARQHLLHKAKVSHLRRRGKGRRRTWHEQWYEKRGRGIHCASSREGVGAC